jgi:hypothetical protein
MSDNRDSWIYHCQFHKTPDELNAEMSINPFSIVAYLYVLITSGFVKLCSTLDTVTRRYNTAASKAN